MKITAYKCPDTGEIFEWKRDYDRHRRKFLAEQRKKENHQKVLQAFADKLAKFRDTAQTTSDIEQWIVNFVEVPHPALGGWPPCPYAKKARLERDFEVRLGMDPYFDLVNLSKDGLGGKSVVIYVYNPVEWNYEQFSFSLKEANENYLLKQDILEIGRAHV